MARALVVEREAGAVVADPHDSTGNVQPFQRRRRRPDGKGARVAGGPPWLDAEVELDVGEDQLLVLLLVVEPELEERARLTAVEQREHPAIDVRAVAVDLGHCGPGEMTARGA